MSCLVNIPACTDVTCKFPLYAQVTYKIDENFVYKNGSKIGAISQFEWNDSNTLLTVTFVRRSTNKHLDGQVSKLTLTFPKK